MSVAVPAASASASAAKAPASAMQIPQRVKNPTTGAMIPLSSTPGGSLYGTTPGGTRITYDRSALLGYRNSPLSKSPAMLPAAIINLGVTTESAQAIPEEKLKAPSASAAASTEKGGDEEDLFEME